MKTYRTIVLGLGAMGSATLHHLARHGQPVLGIDRFAPPHARGSSHGDTRITRLAIGEGAQYTPLARRPHALWRELERETGATLLTSTGGLFISSAARSAVLHVPDFFANTLAAAREYEIVHEILDASAIRRRFPVFNVADDEVGYFEPEAGFLRPEACVRAHLDSATRRGAEIHRNETVRGFDASAHGVTVVTDLDRYAAQRLVVAAGPWLASLIGPSLARYFKVYRQQMYWFDVDRDPAPFLPASFPIFIWELQGRPHGFLWASGARRAARRREGRHRAIRDEGRPQIRSMTPWRPLRDCQFICQSRRPLLRGLRRCVRVVSMPLHRHARFWFVHQSVTWIVITSVIVAP